MNGCRSSAFDVVLPIVQTVVHCDRVEQDVEDGNGVRLATAHGTSSFRIHVSHARCRHCETETAESGCCREWGVCGAALMQGRRAAFSSAVRPSGDCRKTDQTEYVRKSRLMRRHDG